MSLSDGPGGLLSDLIEATIVGADTIPGEGYTLYAIQVTNKIDESSWTVYRRYSNFLSLQSQLPSGMIPSECTLHRGVLASSTAAEVVERRRQVLEDFMGVILSQPADLILQIRNVCDFFRLSVAITGGETPPCSSNNSSLISSESSETVPEEQDLKSLTGKVNKLSEERLNRYILTLLNKVGEKCLQTGFPNVGSIYSLIELEHLTCVETNLDSACIVQAIINIPGWQSIISLNNFIRFPTIANSRLMAFKIVRAITRQAGANISVSFILQDDDIAMAQYLAWVKRSAGSGGSERNSTSIIRNRSRSSRAPFPAG